jgi:hypothetical protein
VGRKRVVTAIPYEESDEDEAASLADDSTWNKKDNMHSGCSQEAFCTGAPLHGMV